MFKPYAEIRNNESLINAGLRHGYINDVNELLRGLVSNYERLEKILLHDTENKQSPLENRNISFHLLNPKQIKGRQLLELVTELEEKGYGFMATPNNAPYYNEQRYTIGKGLQPHSEEEQTDDFPKNVQEVEEFIEAIKNALKPQPPKSDQIEIINFYQEYPSGGVAPKSEIKLPYNIDNETLDILDITLTKFGLEDLVEQE